jgi:transcriptional regulator GlxA family with amidase domain
MLTNDARVRLCHARDMLREVVDRPLTIGDVAREATMSPFHFIRQFNAVFGQTPHQFRIRARLDRAKHLLALGNHSVTDVCLEVASRVSAASVICSRAGSGSARRRTGAAFARWSRYRKHSRKSSFPAASP